MPRRRRSPEVTVKQIEHGLRVELRGIIRHYDDLKRPLDRFEIHPLRGANEPRYFVMFDRRDRRNITGLRARIQTLDLPDERILDAVHGFAESVWHLKDRVHRLAKARAMSLDIEALVRSEEALRVCADLANAKKHGGSDNRSGLSPQLGVLAGNDEGDGTGLVRFDTSENGVVELFYEASTKMKELLVTIPTPIPFSVDILVGNGKSSRGDAVVFIHGAFRKWLPAIRELGILHADDAECKALRDRLLSETA